MIERFKDDSSIPSWKRCCIYNFSDAELAQEIMDSDSWDIDFLHDLFWRADMLDEFEDIVCKAVKKLGVEID